MGIQAAGRVHVPRIRHDVPEIPRQQGGTAEGKAHGLRDPETRHGSLRLERKKVQPCGPVHRGRDGDRGHEHAERSDHHQGHRHEMDALGRTGRR